MYDRAKERPKYVKNSRIKKFFSKHEKRPRHVQTRINRWLDKQIEEELNRGIDLLPLYEKIIEVPEYVKRSKIKTYFSKQEIESPGHAQIRISKRLDKKVEESLYKIINLLPKMTTRKNKIIYVRKTLLLSDLRKLDNF
ncbi:MAG: hypothetical protein ACTSPD_21565 [Promethearchaeota archaeon]